MTCGCPALLCTPPWARLPTVRTCLFAWGLSGPWGHSACTSWKPQGILSFGGASTSDKWELAHQWPSPHTSWVPPVSQNSTWDSSCLHSSSCYEDMLIIGFPSQSHFCTPVMG